MRGTDPGESTRQLLAYAAVTVLHILQVWLLRYFPTQDGPSHLYNLVILHDLLNGGQVWGAYFTHDLKAVPNLGFLAFSYPLIPFFSPYVVEKLFLSLYILLMSTAVPVFLRTFGNRPFPLAFLVFPIIFNYTLMMGFYSYAIAVPCMILAISVAWSRRARPLPRLFLLYGAMGAVLFYLHLVPFIIYLVFLSIMVLTTGEGAEKIHQRLFHLAFLTAPSLALVAGYYIHRPPSAPSSLQQNMAPEHLLDLAVQLLLFSVNSLSRWQILPWTAFFALTYLLLKAGIKEYAETKSLHSGQRALLGVAIFLTGCYFLLPESFAGGGFFNARLPWVILLVMLPLLKIPRNGFLRSSAPVALGSTVLASLLANGIVFHDRSGMVQEFLGGMNGGIPRGSIIATYKTERDEWARVDVLMHAASYYGIEKKCINAGNYEVASSLFPVHFRNSMPEFPPASLIAYCPSRIDWGKYPAIQFLLGWKVDLAGRAKIAGQFVPAIDGDRFSLWKRH